MIGGIPKLLGRGFLVGFVLPVTVHYAFILFVLIESKAEQEISWRKLATAEGVGPSVLIVVILAVLLMALNRTIVRLFEGYPIDDFYATIGRIPLVGQAVQRGYDEAKAETFKKHVEPILKEMDRLDEERKTNPAAASLITGFRQKAIRVIQMFPDRPEHLLPTKFGNAMRAFEVYSRVVYGLESTESWNRMSMVLPKAALEQLQESRIPLDFNLNIIALSGPTTVAVIYISCLNGYANLLWVAVPLIASCFVWMSLPSLAIQWGEKYKGVFDLFRGRLAKQLGLAIPQNPAEEREMWRQVSRAMMYRRSMAIDALVQFRAPTIAEQSADSRDGAGALKPKRKDGDEEDDEEEGGTEEEAQDEDDGESGARDEDDAEKERKSKPPVAGDGTMIA